MTNKQIKAAQGAFILASLASTFFYLYKLEPRIQEVQASNIFNGAGAGIIQVANEAGTGTVLNKLVTLTGTPATAIRTNTGTLDGIIGICIAGCGTTGNATIVTGGAVLPCIFDSSTTAGNYVINDTSTNGDCQDSGTGSALPVSTAGVQAVGRVIATNVGAGTYNVFLFPAPATTKFRNGLYLSGGTTGLTPCSNDNIQGIVAGASVWLYAAAGLIIQPQGTGCATPGGPLDVEGGTVGNALTTQGFIKLIAPGGPQTGNNSSATGGVGGPITITGGQGGGFSSGSTSVGGIGGGVTINAGQGGAANSGSTNGTGGDLTLGGGAPGAGAGTAAKRGFTTLQTPYKTSGTAPAPSACGGSPSVSGSDGAGTITEGSVATGCVVTFSQAYTTAPHCILTSQAGLVFTYSVSTTAITITNVGALSSTLIDYYCMQ